LPNNSQEVRKSTKSFQSGENKKKTKKRPLIAAGPADQPEHPGNKALAAVREVLDAAIEQAHRVRGGRNTNRAEAVMSKQGAIAPKRQHFARSYVFLSQLMALRHNNGRAWFADSKLLEKNKLLRELNLPKELIEQCKTEEDQRQERICFAKTQVHKLSLPVSLAY
jgi:hypothetical protein